MCEMRNAMFEVAVDLQQVAKYSVLSCHVCPVVLALVVLDFCV